MKSKLFSTRISIWRQSSTLSRLLGDRPLLPDLEKEINEWLQADSSIKVIDVKQTAAGGSWGPICVFVSVWYEESNNES